MTTYEYSVIPAPRRGFKGKGVKGPEAQFANALTKVMNEAAAQGWEYVRSETLPSEERQGLTGRTTQFRSVLVFRRAVVAEPADAETEETAAPALLAAPLALTPSDEVDDSTQEADIAEEANADDAMTDEAEAEDAPAESEESAPTPTP